MELTKIEKDILAYCAEDDMGLWIIVRWITDRQFDTSIDITDAAKSQVFSMIQALLESNIIEATIWNGREFIRIPGSAEEVIRRISSEWEELGKKPGIGDICWFRATPKGLQVAKKLDLHT